jgi:serine/threonine-protein kinase
MSVVFKATDLRDGSAVAIKMLRDDVADDRESLDIFMNESKVVSMLSHPNIVSIRAVSFKTEKKYLVMEYIDGISLRTYMDKRGALDFEEFISFSEQILAALEHAHSRGVVHRDIKPQNILVLKDGFIKVTDFGIAKVPEKNKGKTISDNAIGTVYYISPEQAAAKSTDSRSDLYSFGVMMYEMATGALPFDDERPISVLMMQIHDKPLPPRRINRSIPRGLEKLILTCMEKDPRRRYQTAKDIFIQIRRLGQNPLCAVPTPKQMAMDARSQRNRTERPPSRSFFPIALGIACAVCFIGLVSVFYGLDALNFGAPGTSSLKVPDSVGVEYSEEIITELGFNEEDYIVTVEYLTSNTVEKGKIISQKPSAGARRKSPCHVTISVSIGPELVTFGDYLMMNWRVAQTKLRSEG